MLRWCVPSQLYICVSINIRLDPTSIHNRFLLLNVRLFFWCFPLFYVKCSFFAVRVLIYFVKILLVSDSCYMVLVIWVGTSFSEVVDMARLSSASWILLCIVMANIFWCYIHFWYHMGLRFLCIRFYLSNFHFWKFTFFLV